MGKQATQQLVIDAPRAAYWRQKPSAGLMRHSGHGSQYCSQEYPKLQPSYGMILTGWNF